MNPYSELLSITPDEGFEFTKAMALADGPVDSSFWCDQPWLYSQVMAFLFRCLGYSPAIPRVLTTLLVLLMAFVLGARIDRRRWALWGAGVAFLCFTGPSGVTLSCSFLLEAPAWALGMVAFSVPRLFTGRGPWLGALISGVLAACAVHTKPTALLVLPACLVEVIIQSGVFSAVGSGNDGNCLPSRHALRACAVWLLSATVVFLAAMRIAPYWDWHRVLGTHTQTLFALSGGNAAFRLDSAALLAHLDKLLLCLVAIVLAIRKQAIPEVAGSAVLVGSVVAAHAVVRPWWFHYQVHWTIALSVLSLQGLKLLLDDPVADQGTTVSAERRSPFVFATTIFCALLWTSVLVFGVERMYADYSEVMNREHIGESPILAKIVSYRDQSRWLFTPSRIYSFHSRIPIPPEVRWLSRKRFWSGQISTANIIDTVKAYRPEQILLSHEETQMSEWSAILTNGYSRVLLDAANQLWVRKDVATTYVSRMGSRPDARKDAGIIK